MSLPLRHIDAAAISIFDIFHAIRLRRCLFFALYALSRFFFSRHYVVIVAAYYYAYFSPIRSCCRYFRRFDAMPRHDDFSLSPRRLTRRFDAYALQATLRA